MSTSLPVPAGVRPPSPARDSRRILAVVATAATLCALAAPVWAAHPQTVWNASELAYLRSVRGTTHAALANNLKAMLDRYPNGVPGANVAGYAMASRIWEGPYPARAVTSLMAHCSATWSNDLDLFQASDLKNGAIGYDVLYDLLTTSQRDTCRNKIAASATSLAAAATSGIWWVTDMVQNHNWVNHAAIGLAGQALEGEHGSAASWRNIAQANFQKIKMIQDLIPDGSWHEGIGYMSFGTSNIIAYSVGAVRRGINDDATELFRGLGRYILHVQQPNHPRIHVMTHGDANWVRPGLLLSVRWGARRFRDSLAQEAARRWDLEPRNPNRDYALDYALEYAVYDPGLSLPDMSRVPLDLYAEDQQLSVLRTSWDWGTSAQTVVLGFKAGVFGGRGNYERMRSPGPPGGSLDFAHDHEDDLGLWIYGKGGWLLPEATAYNCCSGGPDYHSTPWHNAFLFDGQGQLGDDKNPSLDGMCYGCNHPWFFAREASMPLHVSTDHYAFARGDGRRLYPASLGIQTLLRTVGLSRENGGFIALQDRVLLSSARGIEQLFHFQETADDDGVWLRGVNENGTVLGIRVLSPASHTAAFAFQQSNDYYSLDRDGRFSYVRLSPPVPESNVAFLELLWPTTEAQWGSRPDVQPLDASRPHRGFSVPLGASDEAWIYNATGTTTQAGTLVIEGGSSGDIGVKRARRSDGALERILLQGQGRLLDQSGARTLLDLGTSTGALEVAFTGMRADLSGTATVVGVRFHGPAVTEVFHEGRPVVWTRLGDMVIVLATDLIFADGFQDP